MNHIAVKLVIVGVAWPPETFLRRKFEGLARRGLDLTITTHTPLRGFRNNLSGVRVIRLPHYADPVVLRLFQFIFLHLQLAVRRGGFERIAAIWSASAGKALKERFSFLLHGLALARLDPQAAHFEWPSAAFSYGYMCRIWNCPMTLSLRGRQINVDPHLPGNESLAKRLAALFEEASAVHCVSDAILQEAEEFGLEPSQATVIRPAVDVDFFYPSTGRQEEDGRFRIVSTGSLIWRKGYEYALSAIRRLKDLGIPVKYQIIGDGPERQRIQYTIIDLGLEEQVSLLGSRSPDEVRDALQQADAFLLTSLSEGISNAVLEAMACGLPVVTTDCGGMREAVTNGVEGFVVPVRDPQAAAEALFKLSCDPDLRHQMGAAGRQRVVAEFSLSQHVEGFIQLCSRAVGSFSGREKSN